MRILAVDDNAVVRDLIPNIFKETPFPPVCMRGSGAAALELLTNDQQDFDCFILDIEMPEMDGIELCSRIRQIEQYQDVPVIMLTSRTDGDTIERAFAAGANDYIFKRFDPKNFTERLYVAERYMKKNIGTHRICPLSFDPLSSFGLHDFSFSQGFSITGVDRMILPFSLGNYISQLPAEDRNTCQVFAVQIENAHDLYALGRSQDYVAILRDIAHTINDELDMPRLLMAYKGSGVFICVLRSDDIINQDDLARAIFARVMDSGIHTLYGWPIKPVISVGIPVAPSTSRNLMVKTTFDRATERAATSRATKYGDYPDL